MSCSSTRTPSSPTAGSMRSCGAPTPIRASGRPRPFPTMPRFAPFRSFATTIAFAGDEQSEAIREALASSAVPTYPDLPTGVGFCLYIRRALIDAIGIFDPVFGLGYGEENDLCMRAAQAGFRNVLCDDAFVLHLGGRSFEGRKADLGTRNMELLLERHPNYLDIVREYIAADPLRAIRAAALSALRLRRAPSTACSTWSMVTAAAPSITCVR